ncbi:hypothetical protein AAMO2058_001308800 [Amorphochlora amoebiformis]
MAAFLLGDFFLLLLSLLPLSSALTGCTDRPVIGVLTVPIRGSRCSTYAGRPGYVTGNGGSCFDSVYVKWIESAGGRVIPIPYDLPSHEVERVFDTLNGVLFTGGGEVLTDLSSPFMQTTGLLFNLTIRRNDLGNFFPLWGTCMGFQTLNILAAGNPNVLTVNKFDSEGLSLPLYPSLEWNTSRLIGGLTRPDREALIRNNITTNFHHDGVYPDAYNKYPKLSQFFRIISTNVDRKGRSFVSTIESRDYPIYGTQWHPERNQFEFWDNSSKDPINHSATGVRVMGSLSEFFIGEARKACSRMKPNRSTLIFNFQPEPLGSPSQSYLFPPAHNQ